MSAINVSSLNLSTIAAGCQFFKRTVSNSSMCILTFPPFVFSCSLYRKYPEDAQKKFGKAVVLIE